MSDGEGVIGVCPLVCMRFTTVSIDMPWMAIILLSAVITGLFVYLTERWLG